MDITDQPTQANHQGWRTPHPFVWDVPHVFIFNQWPLINRTCTHQSSLFTNQSRKYTHQMINDHAGILITFNRLPSRDKVTSSVKLAEWTKSNSDKHNVVLSSARYLTKMIWSDILSEFFIFFYQSQIVKGTRGPKRKDDRRVAGRQYPRPWDMRWVYLSHSPH